jgi:hypothetical protein
MFHNDLLSCEVKEKPDVFVRLRMAVSQEPGQRSTSGSLKKALESQRTKLEGNRCNNSRLSKLSETSEISEALSRCRLWVKSAVLTLRRSGLPRSTDIQDARRHVSNVPNPDSCTATKRGIYSITYRRTRARAHSGNPAFRRPSINSFKCDCLRRPILADIVKAGSVSSRRAAASRASPSRPR